LHPRLGLASVLFELTGVDDKVSNDWITWEWFDLEFAIGDEVSNTSNIGQNYTTVCTDSGCCSCAYDATTECKAAVNISLECHEEVFKGY
jgi:hypothetical protein